jgi:hypothetical protein
LYGKKKTKEVKLCFILSLIFPRSIYMSNDQTNGDLQLIVNLHEIPGLGVCCRPIQGPAQGRQVNKGNFYFLIMVENFIFTNSLNTGILLMIKKKRNAVLVQKTFVYAKQNKNSI